MTLKELQELMDLCRKKGVREIKLADVSLILGEAPPKLPRGRAAQKARAEAEGETAEEFERMAFYSAGQMSEDN